MMDSNKNKSKAKQKNKNIIPRTKHLSVWETCASGMIMGFIAYSGSFSAVPLAFTITALLFGTKSWITTVATAVGQLAAGYLHTHSSRTGMAVSTKIFHGFYIAKSDMKNRRKYNETRWKSLKRFFILAPMNALVINLMWETFTIFYILQTEFIIRYTISLSSTTGLETRLILVHGLTRYLSGCLSGMSTGLINHTWQRYRARSKIPYATFNTDKKKLKLEWSERKKLLSPFNMENWIKVIVMIIGALFIIASNIPNITGLHLLSLRKKKLLSDILVIHGGWLFIRDGLMLVLKKAEKPPNIPLNNMESSPVAEQTKILNDEDQSETSTNVAETQ